MPLSPLSAADHHALATLVLGAALESEQDIPPRLRVTLSPEERAYLLEKSAQVSGRPTLLLELLAKRPPAGKSKLAHERHFLRGFALSRLGRESEAAADFALLPRRFQARIQTERALTRVNRGDFAGAEELFRSALSEVAEADPYSLCTRLGGLTLALLHQGDFRGAEKCLAERRRTLRRHPSPVLAFGTRLYEILLLLEKNEFSSAASLLARALDEESRESVNGFFLLHLEARLHLARHELAAAGKSLTDLGRLQTILGLPEGVLDFRLEMVEWRLRSNQAKEAGDLLSDLKQQAAKRGDDFLRFRLLTLSAEILHQLNRPEEAIREIQAAIELGEARRYRPMLSWAFFHAAGIMVRAGHPMPAKLFLHRGRRLAEELRLQARFACFAYMTEVLESRYASASSLVSLAKHQEIGPELEFLLDRYGLLGVVSVEVKQGGKRETVAEPQLRRMLFRSPGVFWFQKEGVLLSNRGESVESLELPAGAALKDAFRLFWEDEGRQGLSLRDLHRLASPHPYREERDGPSTKVRLSRLRAWLRPTGITVEFEREAGRYFLRSPHPTYTIRSAPSKLPNYAPAPRRDRGEEILARIAMEGFVSTRTLCEEFRVSRQALHPFLAALQKKGKIRLIRRGPISGYLYRGGSR